MRYLRTEKLRSFHLRPFIVLTITKRAHYKAERETMCSVNVLKLVSPNQPDLQQLWGQWLGLGRGWLHGRKLGLGLTTPATAHGIKTGQL